MNELAFRRFNRVLVDYIQPKLKAFDLDPAGLKFTGDGWLYFCPDLERTSALVALTMMISKNFQKDVAKGLAIPANEVPALRLAICSGEDESVDFGNGHIEWVGDSARRATRAAGCCRPNQVIVNSTVREKLIRVVQSTSIKVDDLPEELKPKKWEEDFAIYGLGEIRSDFIEALKALPEPAIYAPYAIYLEAIGNQVASKAMLIAASDAVEQNAFRLIAPAQGNPAESDLRTGEQLRSILFAASNGDVRNDLLRRMRRHGVSLRVRDYNGLIARSKSYAEAIYWWHELHNDRLQGDVYTYSTLINLSPDLKTAEGWFKAMREAGVTPNEVTCTTMASKVRSRDEADKLTTLLVEIGAFVGQGYFGALCTQIAAECTAEELLSWHAKQKFRYARALEPAIRMFASRGRIADACRVALAFPFVEAARRVFRRHADECISYYAALERAGFEPHNTTYALGYCYLECGKPELAMEMFLKALPFAKLDKRAADIQRQIAYLRNTN